ncbi:MAG: hypothetical protein D4S01_10425 [Dehalococcoidia bacterium]|nr:MAG: hypothetical protein D4S01_10425 [Dehalococcoidia bacterium]
MNTEIKEIYNGYEVTNDKWTCSLTDGDGVKDISLGVFVEITDMTDEDEVGKHPFLLDCRVVPNLINLSDESIDKLVKNTSLEPDLSDIHHELGSIYVDITTVSSLNEDFTNIDCNELACFLTKEDAERFVHKIIVGRLEAIMSTVGFYFDMPVNRIGTTGWEILESIIYGEDFVKKTLVRQSEMIENQ